MEQFPYSPLFKTVSADEVSYFVYYLLFVIVVGIEGHLVDDGFNRTLDYEGSPYVTLE